MNAPFCTRRILKYFTKAILVLCMGISICLAEAAPLPQASPTPAQNFSISADGNRIAPGGSLLFTATPTSGELPATLKWDVIVDAPTPSPTPAPTNASLGSPVVATTTPAAAASKFRITRQGNTQALLLVDTNAKAPDTGIVTVIACSNAPCSEATAVAAVPITVVDRPGGVVAIPIIGFEQAGASAAQGDQKFFMNFFISRPVPFQNTGFTPCETEGAAKAGQKTKSNKDCEAEKVFGPRWRYWGEVRIATYPQQITTSVAEFAANFAGQFGNVQVNKLAQSGEFNVGLDYRLTSFPKPFASLGNEGKDRVLLSVIGGFGAIGTLNPLESPVKIFENPAANSPQATAFFNEFPGSKGLQFTGFTAPSRDQFFWEYGGGLRLTTLYFDKAGIQAITPAMVSYTLGQNQLVTGGLSRGLVQKVEAFYPLPLGERFDKAVSTIYLFGRADMRLKRGVRQNTPFILAAADPSILASDPRVNIVAQRSNRDVYTIGVGVDAIKLLKTMMLQNKNDKAQSQPAATK